MSKHLSTVTEDDTRPYGKSVKGYRFILVSNYRVEFPVVAKGKGTGVVGVEEYRGYGKTEHNVNTPTYSGGDAQT